MGIGGLDSEFSAIFRRAFASRIFPPGLVEKLGIQHVKGALVYARVVSTEKVRQVKLTSCDNDRYSALRTSWNW